MNSANVVRLTQRNSQAALEALDRITGLSWGTLPISLLQNRVLPTDTSNPQWNRFQQPPASVINLCERRKYMSSHKKSA